MSLLLKMDALTLEGAAGREHIRQLFGLDRQTSKWQARRAQDWAAGRTHIRQQRNVSNVCLNAKCTCLHLNARACTKVRAPGERPSLQMMGSGGRARHAMLGMVSSSGWVTCSTGPFWLVRNHRPAARACVREHRCAWPGETRWDDGCQVRFLHGFRVQL